MRLSRWLFLVKHAIDFNMWYRKFVSHEVALLCNAFLYILLAACGKNNDSGTGKKPVYVKPSIDYKGKFRKGHVRMPVLLSQPVQKNWDGLTFNDNILM